MLEDWTLLIVCEHSAKHGCNTDSKEDPRVHVCKAAVSKSTDETSSDEKATTEVAECLTDSLLDHWVEEVHLLLVVATHHSLLVKLARVIH